MKKVYLLLLFAVTVLNSYSQNPENEALIGITDFELRDGTYSYRNSDNGGVTGFFDKTSWNSSQYLQGHLVESSTDHFRMNYRYLMPTTYDPAYSKGYPLIVMLHGAVERGNCYQAGPNSLQCYYGGKSYAPYNPVTSGFNAQHNSRNNLLNNDHQLINGGQAHMKAVNDALGKKPDDPTLNPRSWPGFVVFPQMLNGWDSWNFNDPQYKNDIYDMVRIVRLMVEKYNINPNQIYIHGLSNGGRGVLAAINVADWLFAAAAPMSAITSPGHSTNFRNDPDAWTVPYWWFQGGRDGNPTPTDTENTISALRQRGAIVRYSRYPNLGHGVWNTAYAEPDFWSWLLSKRKSDLFVAYGLNRICATTGVTQYLQGTPGARIAMPREMYAYQWEKDGQPYGSSSYQIFVSTPGKYRGRFSRVPNPTTEADWNEWSKEVEITVSAPPEPAVTNVKSVMLPDLNGSTSTELIAPANYYSYRWFYTTPSQANIAAYTQQPIQSNIYSITQPSTSRTSYNYYARVIDIDNCYTDGKNIPRTVWYQDGASASPFNAAITTKPKVANFMGSQVSGTNNVLLSWSDTNWERNYEIWRAKSTEANSNTWTLVTITGEDIVQYLDMNLENGVTYYYKIRAISESAKCDYAPSNVKNSALSSDNLIVAITGSDTQKPSIPQNPQAEIYDTDVNTRKMSATLSWDAATDNVGVHHYQIVHGGQTINTTDASTTFTVTDLNINSNYAFRVRAVDAAGNTSNASAQVNLYTSMTGLYYIHNTSFYTDLTSIPEPQWSVREFFGHVDNVDLDEVATQDSYFLVTYYGYLYVSTEGDYNFRINHNDGVRLRVNDQVAVLYNAYVTDEEGCIQTTSSSPIHLTPGFHPVELRYFQSEDSKCLSWEWNGPDTGNGWASVPDERLTTTDDFVPPTLPAVPTDFQVTASGMDNLTLSWVSTDVPLPNFEVYRSLSASGPWELVTTATSTPYVDPGLTPETEYHYRIRSVNDNGASAFTPVVSATTLDDIIAPHVAPVLETPMNPTLTSISLAWSAAEDNVGITGYEIYISPSGGTTFLHSTVQNTYAVVTGLTPQTNYTVYVVAVDARHNESDPSNTQPFTTVSTETYYLKPTSTSGSGITSIANWAANSNGTGANPANFTTNGYYFNVNNGGTFNATLSVLGSSSRIIIPTGKTLTFQGGHGVQGNVEILGTGKLALPSNVQPTFVSLSEQSTVRYISTANQQVQPATYGHLNLEGAGIKTFPAGTTVIRGNLTIDAGVGIAGAANNGSTIILYGNLSCPGPLFTGSTNTVNLEIRKEAAEEAQTQIFSFAGELNINELKVSTPIDIVQSSSSGTLVLGSSNGGGLSLISGASLTIPQSKTLKIVGAGTINGNGETGRLLAEFGSSIDISSSSATNSNLYFDLASNYLSHLKVNMTGGAGVRVLTPVNVMDGIKITNGELNSSGNITLVSDPSNTANLEQIEGTGSIVGNVNVQRFISVKEKVYRYFSASVEDLTVADLQSQGIQISGNFTGRNISNSPSLYILNRSLITDRVEWLPYPTKNSPAPYDNAGSYNSNAAPFEKGKGYSIYLRNNVDLTLNNIGVPFQGTVNFNIISPYTLPAVSYTFDGWNLVGNPYASTIRWTNDGTAWPNRVNISSTVAIRENTSSTTGQFLYYDAVSQIGTNSGTGSFEAGTIAPGQAFYVEATGPGASLSISEAAKINLQQSFYRSADEPKASYLALNLQKDGKFDQAVIVLGQGTDNFDELLDARKKRNDGIWNFSSTTEDQVPTAINNVGDSFCDKRIKLSVQDVTAGTYAIHLADVETFYGAEGITLLDNLLGTEVDLVAEKQYAFQVTSDPASFGADRFELAFRRPELRTDITAEISENCSERNMITLSNTQKGAQYSLIGQAGQVITSLMATGAQSEFVVPSTQLVNGVNTFRIRSEFKGCSSAILPGAVALEFYHSPAVTVADQFVCTGEPALLSAAVLGAEVVSYKWYKADGTIIKGSTGPVLEVGPVYEEQFYSVAPVLKNGCEGSSRTALVGPVDAVEPELSFADDVLSVANVEEAEEYQWTLNGEVIATTIENFITAAEPGVYQVTCKTGNCFKSSKVFSITGTEEGISHESVSVYPNPTNADNIHLKMTTSNNADVLVRVVDILGRQHYANTFAAEQLRSAVSISSPSGFRAGVYFMLVKQGTRLKEIKFIIKD